MLHPGQQAESAWQWCDRSVSALITGGCMRRQFFDNGSPNVLMTMASTIARGYGTVGDRFALPAKYRFRACITLPPNWHNATSNVTLS
jgi:hypothetical protein